MFIYKYVSTYLCITEDVLISGAGGGVTVSYRYTSLYIPIFMFIYTYASTYVCIAEAVLIPMGGAGGEEIVSNRHALEYI